MSEEKLCFVIAPIGEEGSETRIRSDQVLKYVITPPVKELGYEPIRADRISKPGMITGQVIEHIVEDPLVIADLTDRNPNVFYELAIRHAIRKPLVQIIRTGEQIPFDIAGMRAISVDHRDLESVDEAKREIKRQVEALERGSGEIDTPISMTLDLQILRRSEDPRDRSLGEILAAISEVRTSLARIERAMGLGMHEVMWAYDDAIGTRESLSTGENARDWLEELARNRPGDKSLD